MSDLKILPASALSLDPENRNLGTDDGRKLVGESVTLFGYNRPAVVDRNLVAVAGNHVIAEAQARGDEVVIVQSYGQQLLVHVRENVDLDSPEGRASTYYDNEAQKRNYKPDIGRLLLDVERPMVSSMYSESEVEAMRQVLSGDSAGDSKKEDEWETFSLSVSAETYGIWEQVMDLLPGKRKWEKVPKLLEVMDV